MFFLTRSKLRCFSLVLCILFVTVIDFVVMQFESPCPSIFEYALDQNQILFGRVRIHNPIGSNIVLNVELSVGNTVQDYNGNIELAYGRARAVNEILSGRPLDYRINFPAWQVFPPRVTKILLNGELLCAGPPLNIKRVPVLTTINLQHSLKISSLSLSSSDGSFDRPGPFNNNVQPQNNPNPFNNNVQPQYNPNIYGNINLNQPQPIFEIPKEKQNGLFFELGAPNPAQRYPSNPFLNIPSTEKPAGNPFTSFLTNGNWQKVPNTFLNFIPTTQKSQVNTFPPIFTTTQKSPINSYFGIPFIPKPVEEPTPIPIVTTTSSPKIPEKPPQIDVRFSENDVCGKSLSTNSLVANGTPVIRGYFPWLVALYSIKQLNLEFTCGGSLVSTRHVITAAHCLKSYDKKVNIDQLLIILGKYNIQRWTNDKDSLMLSAEAVAIHPDYTPRSADADVAVITLVQVVTFKKFIRPICLWYEDSNLVDVIGENGIVAGWGKDETGATLSPEPKQVSLPIVSQEECLRSHDDFVAITSDRTFCAGYRNGSGPCNGDSGGGFMMRRGDRWTLRGIVSMSIADQSRQCDLGQFLVFTDVSKFSDWLQTIIKQ